MTRTSPVATLSVVLLAPRAELAASAAADRALARGDITGIGAAVGPFDRAPGAVAAAAGRSTADFILVITPDAVIPEHGWAAIAAAGSDPDVGAVRLGAAGPGADPAWRGRRARAHERNLESVRFANLIPLGALAVRRSLLPECLEGLEGRGADWWREVVRRVARRTRVARAPVLVARPRRLEGEPACPSFAPPLTLGRRRVVVLGQIEVSTSLYFDCLEAAPYCEVSFRAWTGLAVDAPHLAGADLVVLVRELHRFWDEGVIELLASAGVPFVYFTDDNFMALAAEAAAPAFYKPLRMRRALKRAAEVWCSTAALAEAHAPLHHRVRVWGPALDRMLEPPSATMRAGPTTIAIAGGDFRLAGLRGVLLDQLSALSASQALRFIVTEAGAHPLRAAAPGAVITVAPKERSFRQFVRAWRSRGVDILLHPAGATANAPFKCPTAAIVAHYLGAVPVVADEPAYDGWEAAEGVLRHGADGEGLAAAVAKANDIPWRTSMSDRLAGALAQRFSPESRLAMLAEVLAATPPRRAPELAQVLSSPRFRRRRAELSLVHAARWVSALAR